MAEFILSAFADEYSQNFDEQLAGLHKNGISNMEIRGADGKMITNMTKQDVLPLKQKLDDSGISVSAIGSAIGKIKITDDFAPHKELLRRVIESAHILGTDRIRMFSFYVDGKYEESRCEVVSRLGELLDIAKSEGALLCHENEKGIYGDTPERCLDIINTFGGGIKCVFDPANFIQVGATPYPDAFNILGEHICYMHIKDADEEGTIVVSGYGKGRIPDILRELDKKSGRMILSLEPHLKVFGGLDALENGEKTKIGSAYKSNAESFEAAANGLKKCIELCRK